MLPGSEQQAYDRAITIFSPDGRLYQVEYAREAVKRGTASIGIATTDGVVLAAFKRVATPLMESGDIEKVLKIDDHIGVATSGHVTDARKLVEILRQEAQRNRAIYQEKIGVETLTRRLCDEMQEYTQVGGVRPFGVSLLVGGVENGEARVFETDPSGSYYEWVATAIGKDSAEIKEILEDEYSDDLDSDEGMGLAFRALDDVTEDEVTPDSLEAAVIDVETEEFHPLSHNEIAEYL